MGYLARRHPIAAALLALVFGPYILAVAVLIGVAYLVAAVIDALVLERR